MDEGVPQGAGQGPQQRSFVGVWEAAQHPGEVQQRNVAEELDKYEEDQRN